VQAAAQSQMSVLQSTPQGAQFDSAYVDQEVAIHKAVIELADKAHGSARNEQLKSLIEQAKPILEKHLEQAEELQKKLGKPAA
jgi:putative membrane protein